MRAADRGRQSVKTGLRYRLAISNSRMPGLCRGDRPVAHANATATPNTRSEYRACQVLRRGGSRTARLSRKTDSHEGAFKGIGISGVRIPLGNPSGTASGRSGATFQRRRVAVIHSVSECPCMSVQVRVRDGQPAPAIQEVSKRTILMVYCLIDDKIIKVISLNIC